ACGARCSSPPRADIDGHHEAGGPGRRGASATQDRRTGPARPEIIMGYSVAVMGATGNVGREILLILAERDFPVDEVVALASDKSTGKEVSFGEKRTLKVQSIASFDFAGIDIVLSSPGAKVSAAYAPVAAAAGAVVIDNTS